VRSFKVNQMVHAARDARRQERVTIDKHMTRTEGRDIDHVHGLLRVCVSPMYHALYLGVVHLGGREVHGRRVSTSRTVYKSESFLSHDKLVVSDTSDQSQISASSCRMTDKPLAILSAILVI
jgi:hypothetical protein